MLKCSLLDQVIVLIECILGAPKACDAAAEAEVKVVASEKEKEDSTAEKSSKEAEAADASLKPGHPLHGFWACKVCTLDNDPQVSACEACGTNRLGLQAGVGAPSATPAGGFSFGASSATSATTGGFSLIGATPATGGFSFGGAKQLTLTEPPPKPGGAKLPESGGGGGGRSERGPIPASFAALRGAMSGEQLYSVLEESCLVPLLQEYLGNESLLDSMDRHQSVFSMVFEVLQAIVGHAPLHPLLLPLEAQVCSV